MPTLNTDLSVTPADPTEAENYPALYALWLELQQCRDSGRVLSEDAFKEWDQKVQALLRPLERSRFQKPLRPGVPINKDTIPHARFRWLYRILRARQGFERLMNNPDD